LDVPRNTVRREVPDIFCKVDRDGHSNDKRESKDQRSRTKTESQSEKRRQSPRRKVGKK